jgi:hypothetical protein
MNPRKKKKYTPLQDRLSGIENEIALRGIKLHYDRLEAAGLTLKGGLCRANGEYHLYVDKRKSTSEKIDILLETLASLPEGELPEQEDTTSTH